MRRSSSIGSGLRDKLADITNSKTIELRIEEHEKPPETLRPTSDSVDQLVKENMTLMKLIADRNKIIDLSGAELQKMKASLQKLQLQNRHLAQSNSRFLAEINLGRDRIKSLEHEISCKEALLKTKHFDIQEGVEIEQSSLTVSNDSKACNSNRKPVTRNRSQSMGPSTSHTAAGAEENVEKKRHCLRRQSARFKSQERDNEEKLFEIEEAKFPKMMPKNRRNSLLSQSNSSAVLREEERDNKSSDLQRCSIGRPSRRAAEKVQSYKEVPLNVKMRREG